MFQPIRIDLNPSVAEMVSLDRTGIDHKQPSLYRVQDLRPLEDTGRENFNSTLRHDNTGPQPDFEDAL